MRSAGQLVVDQRVHAAEIARLHNHVVCGPTASDRNIWTGAIGADSFGRNLTRERSGLCVRPHRYALAIVSGVVAPGVLGLHECDNPVCVKIAAATEPQQHGVSGPQGDNMERMARMRRGGGRMRCDAWERSVALREAVRHGWNAAAVQAALLGNQAALWWGTPVPLG